MESIGWLSSSLLALCAIPQAISALKNKVCYLDKFFLWIWFSGEIFGVAYVSYLVNWPLIFNYSLNTACIVVMLKYRKDPS
jgi:hypothetical protein